MKKFFSDKSGMSLIEVIAAVAIVLVFVSSMMGAYGLYLRLSLENTRKVQATFLVEEGLEVLRILRDKSWSTEISPLSVDTEYFLNWDGVTWDSTLVESYVDATFRRSFILSDVSRDASSDIVGSGGTLDPDTRKVSVQVSWLEQGATTTKEAQIYLTNLFID